MELKLMINHLSTSIKGLLEKSDEILEMFFETDPVELRKALNTKLENGENYIGSVNCEGFDPVTGKCPGHEPKQLQPTKIRIIITELEKRKSDLKMYTMNSLGMKTAYQDAINLIREIYSGEMEVSHA
jgi:hypothetical protein